MNKVNWALTALVILLLGIIGLSVVNIKNSRTEQLQFLPRGTVIAYEDYKGHEVPIIADGKGGEVRWLADVPWAVLPIETRLKFATRGGGYLTKADLKEAWNKFGEWRKVKPVYEPLEGE